MLRFYLNLYIDFGYQRYETPKAQGNDLRPESNNKVQSLLYEIGLGPKRMFIIYWALIYFLVSYSKLLIRLWYLF
jgi:hypothetical protein